VSFNIDGWQDQVIERNKIRLASFERVAEYIEHIVEKTGIFPDNDALTNWTQVQEWPSAASLFATNVSIEDGAGCYLGQEGYPASSEQHYSLCLTADPALQFVPDTGESNIRLKHEDFKVSWSYRLQGIFLILVFSGLAYFTWPKHNRNFLHV